MKIGAIFLLGSMLYSPAGPAEDNIMEITVILTVPDAAWAISIDEVFRVKDELWVIAVLQRMPLMAAQVISTATDTVKIAAPALPVKYFVLGKTWQWQNEEAYTFLKNRDEIAEQLKTAPLLYKKPKKEAAKK